MEFTVEELAIYGLIDADTYIQLTESIIAGVIDSRRLGLQLDRKTRRRIRTRAGEIWRERVAAARPTGSGS